MITLHLSYNFINLNTSRTIISKRIQIKMNKRFYLGGEGILLFKYIKGFIQI